MIAIWRPLSVLAVLFSLAFMPIPPHPIYLPLALNSSAPQPVSIPATYTDFMVTSIGYISIQGEVRNNTDTAKRFITVYADFYDPANNPLGNAWTYVYLHVLPPGDRTCFRIYAKPPAGWSSYKVRVGDYMEAPQGSPRLTPTDIMINNSQPTRYVISGKLRNDEAVPITRAMAIGTLYDARDQVLGCWFDPYPGLDLAPGQSGAFSLSYSGRDYSTVKTYRLQTRGNWPSD